MADIAYCRRFNGSSDELGMGDGGLAGSWSTFTTAAIVRSDDSAAFRTIFSISTPDVLGVGVDPSESLYFYNGSDVIESSTSYVTNAMGWVLVAVTFAGGGSTPRAHRYRYDLSEWNHSNMNSTANAPASMTSDSEVWIGTYDGAAEWWDGDIACLGVWAGTELSDGNLETLTDDIASWESLSPTSLWLLDQSSVSTTVEDRVGTSDETSRDGTTAVSISDLPFDVGGEAAPAPSLFQILGIG